MVPFRRPFHQGAYEFHRDRVSSTLRNWKLEWRRADPALKVFSDRENQEFRNAVDEINARMRQAGYQLHYHNGFIQRSIDPVVEDQIEEPFGILYRT